MDTPTGSQESAPTGDELRYSNIERTLEQFQETARHLGIIASDFNSRSQDALNQKLHTLLSGLQELDSLKNQFSDVKVPLEILKFLDDGKNPQLYTREVLDRTLLKNKEVNGKIEIYKKFQAFLLKEFSDEMPDMVLKYRTLREARPQKEEDEEDEESEGKEPEKEEEQQ